MRMHSQPPSSSPRQNSASRPILSRGTRRDIRRAAALANELNMHSFRLHKDGTMTFTLFHGPAQMPQSPRKATAPNNEPSKRSTHSRDRASAHRELMRKASDFRVKNFFTQWKRTAPSQPQGDDQHQGPTTEPHSEVAAGAPPPPPPALPPPPMQSPPPQGLEQMDDERARKRAAERAESSSVTVVWMTRAERALDRPDRSDFILLRAVWR